MKGATSSGGIMARKPQKSAEKTGVDPTYGYWQQQLADAEQRYSNFCSEGKNTMARYRMEQERQPNYWRDKYNILYSSTETTRPSLYATTPKVQATRRHRDRSNENVVLATMMVESIGQYALEEMDFDDVMNNVVLDYLLPGMGQAWVRYEPRFRTEGEGEDAYQSLDFEGLALDYVHYRDFRTGCGRTWQEIPWVGRRVYFTKKKATDRFGEKIAAKLQYSHKPSGKDREGAASVADQAIIWEIWDKDSRQVIWFSDDYPEGVLDKQDDPLNLKDFFPCPRPVRAVTTTDTFVPQSFYSQYREQADALDTLTQRIRVLTKALRVIGVYDQSQANLAKLLSGTDNRMVPVDNWAQFATSGGINGAVQYVPIKDVATVLSELYKQREIAKAEIYEITGFSDIVRGVSKASETLGAQQLKAEWAGGRLRSMQKEIQRFCRDLIRIMTEIMVEQFEDETLALYAGFEPPPVTPEEQQAIMQYTQQALSGMPPQGPPPQTMQQAAIAKFREVTELLRKERTRCALIGIETDSTIMPDEQQERQDRMEFLGQIGAFLQQAGPMALQYPDMRGLLGAIMMFVVRTFRSSRAIEKEFEDFTEKLQQQPPMGEQGKDGEGKGDDGKAKAQAAVQTAQLKQQGDVQKTQMQIQADQQEQAQDMAFERWKVQQQEETKRQKQQQDHQFRMAELAIKQGELKLKGIEVNLKADDQDHKHEMEYEGNRQQEYQFEAQREDNAEAREKSTEGA